MGVETSEQRVRAAVPDINWHTSEHCSFAQAKAYMGGVPDTEVWDKLLDSNQVVAFESTLRVQDAPEVLREAEGKPHVHVFDSDVLPMQFGENLSPDVERYNSLFCACGHVAHFGTWLAAKPLSPASFDGKFHAFMLIGKMLDVLLPKGHQLTKKQADAVHACAAKLATDLISGEYALRTRPEGEARSQRQRKVAEWCAAAFGVDQAASIPQRMYCPCCGYRWTRDIRESPVCPSCGSEDAEPQQEAA